MNALFGGGMETNATMYETAVGLEDRYATAPLSSVPHPQPMVDEDILHNSFDAAISERLTALNSQWNSRSSLQTLACTTDTLRHVQPNVSTEPLVSSTEQSIYAWPQRIIYCCLALMLLMIGFDLMGLLVLHTH